MRVATLWLKDPHVELTKPPLPKSYLPPKTNNFYLNPLATCPLPQSHPSTSFSKLPISPVKRPPRRNTAGLHPTDLAVTNGPDLFSSSLFKIFKSSRFSG
ncbi:LOW QUALITY PROTEIN: hypothetical protein PanWU01x14_260530 [Parasponia andersonii]|uniref:Uncharacterized protein n=1 Tax=Parasponia andersonii TaxID=3476 RepID=A0A2P5B8V7_PARAD|nr:LOW QUALITY PROTEIN: hypothetical protein PanWU01x14_260530 [Parasponia andersonii]